MSASGGVYAVVSIVFKVYLLRRSDMLKLLVTVGALGRIQRLSHTSKVIGRYNQ